MTDETAIVLRVTSLESRGHIEPLAEKYGWPVIIGPVPYPKGFILEFEQDRLQLRDASFPKVKPLFVDFLSGNLRHRRRFGLSKTQVFARAIGVTSRPGRTVLDTTAGMGVDAFFLACLDCKVTAIERSPLVYELLQDGYRRALHDDEIGEWLADYLRFVQADAFDYLKALPESERPQVVYLDPMFPDTEEKTALPKKEMQFFRKLIGSDEDSARVFVEARKQALERVVVKRPNGSSAISPAPTHVFEGKTARYDMYATGPRASSQRPQ